MTTTYTGPYCNPNPRTLTATVIHEPLLQLKFTSRYCNPNPRTLTATLIHEHLLQPQSTSSYCNPNPRSLIWCNPSPHEARPSDVLQYRPACRYRPDICRCRPAISRCRPDIHDMGQAYGVSKHGFYSASTPRDSEALVNQSSDHELTRTRMFLIQF